MSEAACQHEYRQIAVYTDRCFRNYETLYCEKCFDIAGRWVGSAEIERPSQFYPFNTDPKERLRVSIVFPMTFSEFADALFSRLSAEPNIEPFGLKMMDGKIDEGGRQILRSAIPNSDLVIFLSAPRNLPIVLKELVPPNSKPVIIVRPGPSLSSHELHLLAQGYMVVAPTTVPDLHLLIKGRAPSIVYRAPGNLVHASDFKIEMASLAQQMAFALEKDPDALIKMHHRKFEELVAELLEKAGYKVELTQQSHDGGVDIFAVQSNAFGRFLTIVDCKKYARTQTIGPEIVRTMFGTLNIHNASHGMIATTTTFTAGAKDLEKQFEFRLSLKDHSAVAAWIGQHGLGS